MKEINFYPTAKKKRRKQKKKYVAHWREHDEGVVGRMAMEFMEKRELFSLSH